MSDVGSHRLDERIFGSTVQQDNCGRHQAQLDRCGKPVHAVDNDTVVTTRQKWRPVTSSSDQTIHMIKVERSVAE
jgi:hypothetical protein